MATFLGMLFFSVGFSYVITLVAIPVLGKIALRLGIVDIPDGKIKVHEKVTPYLGGVGVALGFFGTLLIILVFDPGIFSHPLLFLVVGSAVLLGVGLIDDVLIMRPLQKIIGQLLAAALFIKGGLYLKEQFFHDFFAIGILLSVLWVITIINAINLVDVMDGLSTTIALGAGISFFLISFLLGTHSLCLVLGAFLGPLLAFLRYNWPPARIYLGDAGSLYVGGFLAAMPFMLPWSLYNPYGYITPIIVLAIPLLEVATLIIIRTYKGIPFYKASPDHFSIYLQKKGWSKQAVLYYIAGLNGIILLLSAGFVVHKISLFFVVVTSIFMFFFWFFILFLSKNRL